MTLPPPGNAFEWTNAFGPAALVCLPLAPLARHLFTSRLWPLATAAGAGAESAWNSVGHALGADGSRLLRARQVHGAAVLIHRGGEAFGQTAAADILVAGGDEVVAAIQTADCVPVLIADSRSGTVAAAHAGWRGLAQRVPQTAIRAMVDSFAARESDLIAAIGPSIGACCYEVGGDVRDRFAAAGFEAREMARWFGRELRPSPANPPMTGMPPDVRAGHWVLDVWAATRDQLRAAGVRADRIFVAGLCTASHPGAFCSFRRDGAAAGRMAAAIGPRPESYVASEFSRTTDQSG
ncbi:MAG: peptidoglycan editing factor PgeF [Acidobacteriota bacterium]